MVSIKKYELPSAYAAFGAVLSFYLYPFIKSPPWIINGAFFLFAVIFGFLVILRETFFLTAPENHALKRRAGKLFLFFTAAAVGFSIGLAARGRLPSGPALGLEMKRVGAISGVLKEDPRRFNDGRGMGVVALRSAEADGGIRAVASGSIVVFFPPEAVDKIAEFGRGCELYAEGRIVSSRDGRPLFRSSAVFITRPASFAERLRVSVRAKLLEKINPGGASAWGALASALLLGVRDNLDGDLGAAFRNAGCSHVLALSGMHLALLSGVLAFFLRRILGFRAAVIAGGFFIAVYVYLAGGQPSLVRAAIMYLLGAVCILGFLPREPFNLLCLAFLLQMIFQSESALSLSFVLSYLSLAGILTLGEIFHFLFRGRIPEIAGSSLSASLGAFAATAPVAALYFGVVHPIGIIAGLVVVPLASLFMIAALAALILLFPFPALSGFFDLVFSRLYGLLELLVFAAGKAPGIKTSPLPALFFCAGISALFIFLKIKDEKRKARVDPFET